MASDKHSKPSAHETSDADVGAIFKLGVGLVALILLALGGTWFLYGWLGDAEPGEDRGSLLAETPRVVPPPVLGEHRLDLEAIRAREREILNGYGWIDREEGIVRMPVERAMEMWLEREAPVRGLQDTGEPGQERP